MNELMKATLLTFIAFLFAGMFATAQRSKTRMLFVIDSIPVIHDLPEWDQLEQRDIADMSVITNEDSIRLLGWSNVDGITYIFTNAYRRRPDSIKKIPSLKQMQVIDGAWNWRGSPYTGKYIDYYNNGSIQDEGLLIDGKLNGEFTIYFKNGVKQSTTNYVDNTVYGRKYGYYKNGAIRESRHIVHGRDTCGSKSYFINGQLSTETRCGSRSAYDTFYTYFSNGKLRSKRLIGHNSESVYLNNKDENLAYYSTLFLQALNSRDVRKANQYFYHLWLLDPSSIETDVKNGRLLMLETRYDAAIEQFDSALAIEPLMREAYLFRAVARIKKNRTVQEGKRGPNIPITLQDLHNIPEKELGKICSDILKVDELDPGDMLILKQMPYSVLKFCLNK